MADGEAAANLGNVGELDDLFEGGGGVEDGETEHDLSNLTEEDLDKLSDLEELRKVAKSLLRQRNEVMDLIGAARKKRSGDLASELGLGDLTAGLSELLMLDTPAGGSSGPKKESDPKALTHESLPDLDSIGDSMLGMSNAFSELMMVDSKSSPKGTDKKAVEETKETVASLPDFEDIADSAADLADTVSNFGSMLSEAFMMDSGTNSSSAKETLRAKLRMFYKQHNPEKMQAADAETWLAGVVDFYASKPAELNQRLKEQYGVDLTSVSATSTRANPPAAAGAGGAGGAAGATAAGAAEPSLEDEVDALLGDDDGLAVVDLN
jgi:hypothetical protein